MQRTEARIVEDKNVLVVDSPWPEHQASLKDFCGSVIAAAELPARLAELAGKTVYLGGDVARLQGLELGAAKRVLVVRELARGHEEAGHRWPVVEAARLPMLVRGLGVYYRRFFDASADTYQQICREHTFQTLTESTKPGTAHRTGIYLTPVQQAGDELHFRLLRCSTNLSGPTENFRANDRQLVDALNHEAAAVFEDQAPLNHVLAQRYHNTRSATTQKQAKAKISAHADKTKDMPGNGIMAFCTFYDQLDKLGPLPDDPFDRGHHGISGLTRLRFRRKEQAGERAAPGLPDEVTLTLYPDSVFFMPLSTNRLYTHELQSSMLDAERLPTRLGYVVRCSSAEAVHKEGHTFLKTSGGLVKLEPPTPEGMKDLRQLYAEENKTTDVIEYGDRFRFSMNQGDYTAPRL
ncbi:MAG: hypothetical protein IPI49_25615 [Myxococcales bacterium]|nr:hypothetical protein [Myxococcales bacterium]